MMPAIIIEIIGDRGDRIFCAKIKAQASGIQQMRADTGQAGGIIISPCDNRFIVRVHIIALKPEG